MRKFLLIAACAGMLAGCSISVGGGGSESPSPSAPANSRPTKALTYITGSADVAVSGAQQAAFTAALDSQRSATFEPDDGFDVWWRSGDQALNVSGDVEGGKVDAFVRVETGKGDANAYIDPFHTLCTVVVTEYSDTKLAGTFSCPELQNFSDSKRTVNATGTFSASV